MQAKASNASSLGPLVDHVVIIIKENHTYDNYFGTFPHSEGDNQRAQHRILHPATRTIVMKRGSSLRLSSGIGCNTRRRRFPAIFALAPQ